MRILGLLLCFCLLSSCNWFPSREKKTNQLVELEMSSINWNELDQYPLFPDCDETALKAAQKDCFERILLANFTSTLREFEFVMDTEIQDTLYLDFLVSNKGEILVLDIEKHELILEQIPEFEGIITQSLKTLPPLAPALKRGIPVNAKFRIPMILNTSL